MEVLLVETDFLFGLRKGDKLHTVVQRLLRLHGRRVRLLISQAAPLEAYLVMLSRGLSQDIVSKAFRLMEAKLAENRVNNYAPLTLETMALAGQLREKYSRLTLFDALHASTAVISHTTLLTSDKLLAEVLAKEGHPATTYKEIMRKLEAE